MPLLPIGIQFERLTVVGYQGRAGNHHRYLCACVCGKQTFVWETNLRQGITRSCGCIRREVAAVHLRNVHRKRKESSNEPQ